MGEWKQLGNKLAYMFGPLTGWQPGADVISRVGGGVYNCQNVRFEDGKVKSRGGWRQLTTGDTNISGIYGFKATGTNRLVSVKQNDNFNCDLRYYDFSNDAWYDPELLRRFLNAATPDFCVMPKSDGNHFLVMTDGVNPNLKWDFQTASFELTSKLIFDSELDESWAFSDNGVRSVGAVITGTYAIGLTDDGADGDTGTYTIAGPVYSNTPGYLFTSDIRIGDSGGTEMALAIKVPLTEDTTFDQVQLDVILNQTPTGTIAVKCVTDDGSGNPTTDLIAANAQNATATSASADGVWTVTLDAAITYNKTFWITFIAAAQGINDHWQAEHGGSHTSGVINTLTSTDAGSTWTEANQSTNIRLLSTADYLDLETNYADGDEIILWAYLDDTLTDIDAANSNIVFTDGDGDSMTFVFTNQTFTSGEWVQWIISRQSSTTGDWTESGTMDWSRVATIAITITDGGSDVAVVFDNCYIRKTRVDNTTTGTKTRPYIGKFCEPSPHGDRLLIANTEQLGDENLTYPSGPQYIWFSDAYNIDSFTNTNFIAMPEDITGMKTFGGLVHVFSDSKRWVMEPNYSASDFNYDASSSSLYWNIRLAQGPGCVSNRSIAVGEYNNQHGIFFLSKDGVYFTNGLEALRISGSLDILFKEPYSASDLFYSDMIDPANWDKAAGIWYQDRYFLSYYAKGDSDNQATILLNTKTGGWERDVNGGSVFPVMYATSDDSSNLPQLLCCADNGEVYQYEPSRSTVADDGNAYQSDFQTTFIGTDLMREVDWQTLNIWVRAATTNASSIIVKIFTIEDYDDTAAYTEWEEDPDTAIATITTAWTPNTAFKWHRLRIALDDNTNTVYPRSRAIALQIYDDNDKPIEYWLESLVCEPLHEELR